MITILYRVVDDSGDSVGSPLQKTFSSQEERITYEMKQNEHPFLSLEVVKEIKN